jgi:hypothetical protein
MAISAANADSPIIAGEVITHRVVANQLGIKEQHAYHNSNYSKRKQIACGCHKYTFCELLAAGNATVQLCCDKLYALRSYTQIPIDNTDAP